MSCRSKGARSKPTRGYGLQAGSSIAGAASATPAVMQSPPPAALAPVFATALPASPFAMVQQQQQAGMLPYPPPPPAGYDASLSAARQGNPQLQQQWQPDGDSWSAHESEEEEGEQENSPPARCRPPAPASWLQSPVTRCAGASPMALPRPSAPIAIPPRGGAAAVAGASPLVPTPMHDAPLSGRREPLAGSAETHGLVKALSFSSWIVPAARATAPPPQQARSYSGHPPTAAAAAISTPQPMPDVQPIITRPPSPPGSPRSRPAARRRVYPDQPDHKPQPCPATHHHAGKAVGGCG